MDYYQLFDMERELSMLMSRVKIGEMIDEATMPFKELMAYYKCAMMQVEVQLRTLAMDIWASQEHQIRYKKDSGATDRSFGEELLQCADMCARVDEIMDTVHKYSKQC